jgi:hypothetical protein
MLRATLLVLTALTPLTASAADKGAAGDTTGAAQAASAPKLPPEGRRWLDAFPGMWKATDVTFTVGDKPMKGTLVMSCGKTSRGWGTLCQGTIRYKKSAIPQQELTLLMGWDLGSAMAHMYEVTNTAAVHDHAGAWKDDQTITVVHRGKDAGGKDEEDSLTFSWQSPKVVLVKGEGKAGGAAAWTFAGTMRK